MVQPPPPRSLPQHQASIQLHVDFMTRRKFREKWRRVFVADEKKLLKSPPALILADSSYLVTVTRDIIVNGKNVPVKIAVRVDRVIRLEQQISLCRYARPQKALHAVHNTTFAEVESERIAWCCHQVHLLPLRGPCTCRPAGPASHSPFPFLPSLPLPHSLPVTSLPLPFHPLLPFRSEPF